MKLNNFFRIFGSIIICISCFPYPSFTQVFRITPSSNLTLESNTNLVYFPDLHGDLSLRTESKQVITLSQSNNLKYINHSLLLDKVQINRRGKGALKGAGIGLLFGVLIGIQGSDSFVSTGQLMSITALFGASVGAIFGAIFPPKGTDYKPWKP